VIHSLSRLGTFEKCAKKYEFKYVKKLPEQRGPSANRGIEQHAIIEAYLDGKLPELPADLSFYQSFLEGLRSRPIQSEAKLAVNEYWEAVEWDDQNVYIRSVLDLLIPLDQQVHIYDWKTGKIYDDHDDQKELYTLIAAAHYPDSSDFLATHVYLDLGQNRYKKYSREELQPMRERWMARFEKQEKATEFPYNPQYSCRWCSFSKKNGGPCLF
jgi:hypothetical protein